LQVSILAALVAGLISFLSPCVLPLVPGYISMLSGIGVEQLRRGEKPRGSLLASSFAFVMGFSVVFVAFGASASAVGRFLLQNKNLLAPFAGAIIVLFGLHLIGLLGRIPVRGSDRGRAACRGLSDFRQPAHLAFRQTEFSRRRRQVRDIGQ
jgi:cytochrome c-type biogenesis protein